MSGAAGEWQTAISLARPRAAELWLLAIIVAVAAAWRLAWPASAPPAMMADECIRGYDAWSLWRTGADYRGARWPAYLEAFGPGDYPSAISAYLTAPFVGVGGLHTAMVKLPFALAGVATVVLLWAWLRRETTPAAGLFAAASLAVSPWHVQVSRMAFEGGLTPLLVTAGGLCLVRKERVRAGWSFVGGVACGAGMWAYSAPRLLVPLLGLAWLACRGCSAAAAWRSRARATAWATAGLALGGAPMWVTLLGDPTPVLARGRAVSLFGGMEAWSALWTALRQYAAHFDPAVLFFRGDAWPHLLPPGLGFAPWYEGALIPVGLATCVRRMRDVPLARFLLVWFLLYPVPAALARNGGPHMLRSIVGVPLLAILAGIGAEAAVRWAVRRGGTTARRTVGPALVVVAATQLAHAAYYFRQYPGETAEVFPTDLEAAFTWAGEHPGAFDAGALAFPANQAFAQYLFFTRMDPPVAQRAAVERRPWVEGFEEVRRFGAFAFCPAHGRRAWEEPELLRQLNALPSGTRLLVLARPGQIRRTRPVATVSGVCGGPTVELHVWERPVSGAPADADR